MITKPAHERGLTIVENIAAMTIMFAAMGGVAMLMLSYQLQNVKNEIKSGGIAAAEQLMDQLRQCNTRTLPKSGTTTIPASNTVTVKFCGLAIPPLRYAGNKLFSAKVTYCKNSTYCDDKTRHLNVEIFYENTSIYQTETVYTALQ
jgi:type II secretory pathway pseudopilin PulG